MMNGSLLESIFMPGLSGIKIQNCVDENGKTEVKRMMTTHNSDLLSPDTIPEIDLDNIQTIPEGRFSIKYKNVPFEMFFHNKPNLPLIVVLNGTLMAEYPEFKRWSWCNFMQGSMLNIADPMYEKHKGLRLGWYYGDKQKDYRKILSQIIIKIAAFLNISNENIVFYSSSGGVAASFEIASYIEGSTCIAINPQLYLEDYHYYDSFKKITKQNPEEDRFHRNSITHWINRNSKTKYIIVGNVYSADDKTALTRLADELDLDLRYGISKKNNLIVWCYSAVSDEPHNAQEDYCMHFPIMFLKNLFSETVDFHHYENLYVLFSELWSNKWLLLNEKKLEKPTFVLDKKFSTVYDRENLDITASESIYNAYALDFDLTPNTYYRITAKGAFSTNEDIQKYAIGIKDTKKNALLIKRKLLMGTDHAEFLLGPSAQNLQLRIYTGEPGKAENTTLHIDKLIIKAKKMH